MVFSQLEKIEKLDGSNYSVWKDKIEVILGLSELDYALHNAPPKEPQVEDPDYEHKFMQYGINRVKWEKSNKKCLMAIKYSIAENVKGAITECDTAKEYLERVANQFVGSSKAYASTLTRQFLTMKYDGSGIRAHIQKMSSMVAKLNRYFKAPLPEDFVVHVIMQSLPKDYETFHVNYNNTVKDQWGLDQLMAQCVQEEERLKSHRGDSVNFAQQQHKKKNIHSRQAFKKPGQGKQGASSSNPPNNSNEFPVPYDTCLHCKKQGHYKRQCPEFLRMPSSSWG